MANRFLYKVSKPQQYFSALASVIVVAVACYFLSAYIGYRTVALILMVTVSLTAMFFDIFPVLAAAVLSALIWDFFFIPPHFTLTVGSGEDTLMLVMYFVIALVNAALTFKIRQIEKETSKR